jgi:perosamine synthetase
VQNSDYDEKEEYKIRFNYKLTDIQAALGESQLKKLPASIQRRQEIAEIYNSEIKGQVSSVPTGSNDGKHIYYRYVVSMDDPVRFMAEMLKCGIECRRPVFKPLHRYLDLSGYPASEDSWARAVSIPIYPSLTEKEVLDISAAMKKSLGRC